MKTKDDARALFGLFFQERHNFYNHFSPIVKLEARELTWWFDDWVDECLEATPTGYEI